MKTLVQIGCNVGNDEVYKILSESKDKFQAFLVDANIKSLHTCEASYKNMTSLHDLRFDHYAIVSDPTIDSVVLYIPKNDEASPFASTIEHHTTAHSHSVCNPVYVPAITINNFLIKHNMKKLDYLYIDTEGLCVDILLDLNLDILDINTIVFEFIHSDGMLSYGGPKLSKIKEKLVAYNYGLNEIEYNIVCQKNV